MITRDFFAMRKKMNELNKSQTGTVIVFVVRVISLLKYFILNDNNNFVTVLLLVYNTF